MKAKDIEVGGVYAAKVSGRIVAVRITAEHPIRGWAARSLETGREVRIISPQRLRYRREDLG